MNIENDIFKRAKVNFNKLNEYGFRKEKDKYIYEENILDNAFKVIIAISLDGTISGKVIDLDTLEEYTNIRTNMEGIFVSKVREEYKNVLSKILDNCFTSNYFIFNQANRICKYMDDKYKTKPEFLWEKSPNFAVFRNNRNKKWYAIIMNIDYSKIDKKKGEIEIINLKVGNTLVEKLIKNKGYYKAYHMNKKDWITIVLDDTLSDNEIINMIDESYNIINK